uniref:CTLH domain-containing protein n=1 Tax=Sorghum bicolor TaxID=4558 RepID=C6JRY8_SORBI
MDWPQPNSPPPVNWDALDALILDFTRSDRLVAPLPAAPASASPSPPSSPSSSTTTVTSSAPSSSSSSSPSSYRSRLLIRCARRALELGDVDAALALLRAHAPAALADHRLLFFLHKQRFVELVRRGTEADRDAALHCLRTALAPCALDAYPEAYEEFKHIMLVLIYDKDDQSSPVVNEWSIKRRFELAGLLSSMLRAHLEAYDPILSLTLRYLISIHKAFCTRQGISSPISDLTERLLFEDRDPPVVPQEYLLEAPPFDEVDVQALAHAVELTRQGAVDSLKFAKGNLYQALQSSNRSSNSAYCKYHKHFACFETELFVHTCHVQKILLELGLLYLFHYFLFSFHPPITQKHTIKSSTIYMQATKEQWGCL